MSFYPIQEISANLTAGWIKYIIVEEIIPIGFLQYYETDKAPKGHWSGEPIGTLGIDYLIGDKAYLGKSHGSRIVRLLVEHLQLLNVYDYIIADPVVDNISSVKVLESNGFQLKDNGLYGLDLRKTGIKVFEASIEDVASITELFRDTIQNVNSKDYPIDEIEDWSSWWVYHDKWEEKIKEQFFFKAIIDGKLVGFGSLAVDGYLDFLFTHKDFQGRGIAATLIKKIERKAREQGNEVIYSDVSISAKGFFEKHGYVVVRQQLKRSRNKELINFRMQKSILT